MQLYREQARYLERTAPWIERVGLAYVKQHIVEDSESRQALYQRFIESQEIAQHDPWSKLSQQEHRLQFVPMKNLPADKIAVNA